MGIHLNLSSCNNHQPISYQVITTILSVKPSSVKCIFTSIKQKWVMVVTNIKEIHHVDTISREVSVVCVFLLEQNWTRVKSHLNRGF